MSPALLSHDLFLQTQLKRVNYAFNSHVRKVQDERERARDLSKRFDALGPWWMLIEGSGHGCQPCMRQIDGEPGTLSAKLVSDDD